MAHSQPIDGDRSRQILIEVTLGKTRDPRDTPEEAKARADYVREVAEIKRRGGTVEMPE